MSFKENADAFLAKYNWLTTLILLGVVIIPIAYLMLFGEKSAASKQREKEREQAIKNYEPKRVTLKKDSLLCFEREDWEKMKGNIADQNYQGMKILFNEAKCQNPKSQMQVLYLDPVGKNEALIQMPSGKGAYVFAGDISE